MREFGAPENGLGTLLATLARDNLRLWDPRGTKLALGERLVCMRLGYSLALTLLPLALSACDTQEPIEDENVAGDDSAVASENDDDDDDDVTNNDTTDEPSDPSGDPTATPDEPMTDPTCDEFEATQACELASGGSGTQFCDTFGEELLWGECQESEECSLGEVLDCGFCSGEDDKSFECEACGPMKATCALEDGVPTFGQDYCACNTPLVLSFDGAPVQMAATPMATFDINDAGGCISTDWPAAATPWLALDLDRSGSIETGRELFGSGTRLSSGARATDGFMALSELDDNSDGKIDVKDARFSELMLWADHNADKTADFHEMQPLAVRGVLSLDLDYVRDRRCDDRGNCEIERAEFTYIAAGGDIRNGDVVDVHLACQ